MAQSVQGAGACVHGGRRVPARRVLVAVVDEPRGGMGAGGCRRAGAVAIMPSAGGDESRRASQEMVAGVGRSVDPAFTGMASADLANRAATQHQSQEMAAKRLRDETLSRCLSERGYQQFALTPEQNAVLAKLKHGSNEYLEYLYKLGADPAVLAKQSVSSAAKK